MTKAGMGHRGDVPYRLSWLAIIKKYGIILDVFTMIKTIWEVCGKWKKRMLEDVLAEERKSLK